MEVFFGLLLVVGFYYLVIRENEAKDEAHAASPVKSKDYEALAAITGMAIGGTFDPLVKRAAPESEELVEQSSLFIEEEYCDDVEDHTELSLEEMEHLDEFEEFDLF